MPPSATGSERRIILQKDNVDSKLDFLVIKVLGKAAAFLGLKCCFYGFPTDWLSLCRDGGLKPWDASQCRTVESPQRCVEARSTRIKL